MTLPGRKRTVPETRQRGLATRFPHDLFQIELTSGTKILAFAIESPGAADDVTYYKDEKHELLLSAVLMQGQIQVRSEVCANATRVSSFTNFLQVAKKTRELQNRVPGDPTSILWSEDTVKKLTKMSSADNMDITKPEAPAAEKPAAPRKRGRPRKDASAKPAAPKSTPAQNAKGDNTALYANAAQAFGDLQKVFQALASGKKAAAAAPAKRRGRPRKNADDASNPPAKKSKRAPKKSKESVESADEEVMAESGEYSPDELLDF